MSAELLRRAADRIEQLANDCPTNQGDFQQLCSFLLRSGAMPRPLVYWLHAMGPQIGRPLATWPRGEARYWEEERQDCSDAAIEIARLILGEQP